MSSFQKINAEQLHNNFFKAIGREWMLLTAGTEKSYNAMTAGWGTMGVLWRLNVCICFVRPSRYTYELMEKNEYFTLSFFEKKHREQLTYFGTVSGRQEDKIKKAQVNPVIGETGAVYFDEASLVFECKKIYADNIDPKHFIDKGLMNNYPGADYHRFYVGEIRNCLKKA